MGNSMKMGIRIVLLTLAQLMLMLGASAIQAEVYKWQDENGRWHFGDRPPANVKAKVQSSAGAKKAYVSSGPKDNLKEQLLEKYPETTMITEVTMSVVAVETSIGSGSGFFVSEHGHIVTNRHVVRPTSTEQWEETKEDLEDAKYELERIKIDLDEEKELLDKYEIDLKEYRQIVKEEPENSRARVQAERELEIYEGRYERRKKSYQKILKRYRKEKREFDQKSSDLNWKSSLSAVARSFKVYLKDNTQLKAKLVHISDKHDLALLQVVGKLTPTLSVNGSSSNQQGEKVYAVGSPLGMRDSVTSGIITRIDDGFLITDAQILPGNSGGPLINESGEVIGVNTLKLSQDSPMSQGFGIAIPSSLIQSEFGSYLPSPQNPDKKMAKTAEK